MLYIKKKDTLKRSQYLKFEIRQKLLKFLQIYLKNTLNNKNAFNKKFWKYTKIFKFSKTLIKNRCIITNRPKSTNRIFSLSRIQLREYLQIGLFPGYKKAVW